MLVNGTADMQGQRGHIGTEKRSLLRQRIIKIRHG